MTSKTVYDVLWSREIERYHTSGTCYLIQGPSVYPQQPARGGKRGSKLMMTTRYWPQEWRKLWKSE